MRISLTVPDGPLRRAIADLLAAEGYEVLEPGGEDRAEVEVALEPGGPVRAPGRRIAFLRPAPGTAGDPEALLATLGAPGEPAAAGADALPSAPGAWWILDPSGRTAVASNAEGREILASGALPSAVRECAEGRRTVEVDGQSRTLLWWTLPDGRRCAGMLDAPPPDPGESLRTLADIGRTTTTFAHEIRNLLASLAGAVDLLRDELERGERDEVASLARERLHQMRRLLDDTLRLARPVRGSPEALDLEPILRSAIEVTQTDRAFRGVAVSFRPPDPPLFALAYAEPLRQAVSNLLLNAAEAQGGRGAIRVGARAEGRRAVIRVEDDGPGIPPERREAIFDPFWTTKPQGTGLGLPFVRRVAEAAGGRALVEDSPRGTVVRIELPLAGREGR